MALVVKPSAVVKAVWFSIGTGAAYAAYFKLNKDLWSGAKQVGCNSPAGMHIVLGRSSSRHWSL